jgi:hypothetical protein
MAVSDIRLEFAATVFVRECIRQYVRLHPKAKLEDMPVKALAEYPVRDQAALKKAIAVAIEASTGMNDQYRTFVEQKLELARSQPANPQPTEPQ